MKKGAVAQKGFTIVELLIVVVVIAILAAITIVGYNGISNRAKTSSLKSELASAAKALTTKKITDANGLYPASLALAGVNSTTGKLIYHYNTRSNTYCIDGKDGSLEYSISNTSSSVEDGACIIHGMSLWLPMNGNTTDMSGKNQTVTPYGATFTATTGANGAANSAYSFNGTDQYLRIANPDTIPEKNDQFSVSIWTKALSAGGNNYAYYIHKSSTTSVGSSYFNLGINAGTTQYLMASANGQYTPGISTTSASSSVWSHLVLVYAGGWQTTYVNGVQSTDTNIGPITNDTTGTVLTIGAGNGTNRPIVGSLDDARIYDRALTAEEVTNLYNAGAQ